MKPKTRVLRVLITASTSEGIDDLIESLARSACDVVNSTEDDDAHIWISDSPQPKQRGKP